MAGSGIAGCAGVEGKHHDGRMTVIVDDAEAEPLIQPECRVCQSDAERDRGEQALGRGEERAKQGGPHALVAQPRENGNGELRGVGTPIAIATRWSMDAEPCGTDDGGRNRRGDEAEVTGTGTEAGDIPRQLRRLKNGTRRWRGAGRLPESEVEHLFENGLICS